MNYVPFCQIANITSDQQFSKAFSARLIKFLSVSSHITIKNPTGPKWDKRFVDWCDKRCEYLINTNHAMFRTSRTINDIVINHDLSCYVSAVIKKSKPYLNVGKDGELNDDVWTRTPRSSIILSKNVHSN